MATRVFESGAGRRLSRRWLSGLGQLPLGLSFVALYGALDSVCAALEPMQNIGYFYLPAGLSLALVLGYGIHMVPYVILAKVLADVWLNPLELNLGLVLISSAAAGGVYALAASVLGEQRWKARLQIGCRKHLALFLGIGNVSALLLAFISVSGLLYAGTLALDQTSSVVFHATLGNAVGILGITPFLLLHAFPAYDRLAARLGGRESLVKASPAPFRMSETGKVRLLVMLGVVAVAVSAIMLIPVSDKFWQFFFLFFPLMWIALDAGVGSVALALFFLTTGFTGSLWITAPVSPADSVQLQLLLLLVSVNAILVGAAVTDSQLIQRANAYRDRVIESVGFSADQLIGAENWKDGFNEILRRLGRAVRARRVILFETRFQVDDFSFEPSPHGWTSVDAQVEPGQIKLLNALLSNHLGQRGVMLKNGETLHFYSSELPEQEKAILDSLGVRSIAATPISVQRNFWGVLAFDRGIAEGDWGKHELDSLRAAADNLGSLLARVKIEEQFRQLTGNIRAVFWISTPDGARRTYVSPSYEQIWGRSRQALQTEPDSWLDAIHPEDLDRVRSALSKQIRGEFDEEYRILFPDQSVRWIRDRGSPVRDEMGKVTQVVGIAEDVTSHKEAEGKIGETSLLLASLIDNLRSAILVEDEARKIRHVNQTFCELFRLPVSREELFGTDSRLLFSQNRDFSRRLETIVRGGERMLAEEIVYEDSVLKRDYIPLLVSEQGQFHVWQYQDVTAEKQTESKIKSSLQEKEVLLKEIHHRVKNNLQVISSLLSLQFNQITDEQALQVLAESQNRLRAMALIHERLYKSEDLARIDFPGYVENLTDFLVRTYQSASGRIKMRLELEQVPLNIDAAIPCGLIINELVSNSLKYAFSNNQEGEILVRLRKQRNGEILLVIRDDGVGMKEGFDLKNAPSLGLKLVHSLVKQLGGGVEYKNKDGTEFSIRFPLRQGGEA